MPFVFGQSILTDALIGAIVGLLIWGVVKLTAIISKKKNSKNNQDNRPAE